MNKDKIAIVVPSALLIAIGLFHLFQVKAWELTPWKGGGFGMFAFVDERALRCRIEAGGEEYGCGFPKQLKWDVATAKNLPSERHLQRLGERFARVVKSGQAESLRLELWQLDFDFGEKQLRAEKQKEFRFPLTQQTGGK